MKKIKITAILSCLFMLALIISGCSKSDSAGADKNSDDGYTFKIALEENKNELQGLFVQKFEEVMKEKTENEVNFQIYYAGQLGNNTDIFSALKQGTIQFAVSSPGSTGSIIPENQVLSSIPFLFSSDITVNQSVFENSGALNDSLAQVYEEKGVKVLNFWTEGFSNWTANKPLKDLDSLKGFKMRTMPSPIVESAFKAYGANPTPMDFSEVFSGLQLHTIDGQANPLFYIDLQKLHEVQKYVIRSNDILYVTSTLANQKYFNSLPEDMQQAVTDSIKEATDYINQKQISINEEALMNLKNNGMEVVELSSEAREEFKKASSVSKEVYIEQTGSKGEEILNKLEAEIAEAEQK